jgi:NADPH:quinone reductase-like Zn-dependent oxidoreductase
VTKFKTGDHVVAYPGMGMGCHAPYRTMPEDGRIVLKPAALSFAEAAAAEVQYCPADQPFKIHPASHNDSNICLVTPEI